MNNTVTMPTDVAAYLVAGAVNSLWDQWANDKESPGCCTICCLPCTALHRLHLAGELDWLYGHYLHLTGHRKGQSEVWDDIHSQIGREWLLPAWNTVLNCHKMEEMGC